MHSKQSTRTRPLLVSHWPPRDTHPRDHLSRGRKNKSSISANKISSPVLWAQRSSAADPTKNFIYLTISVPDVPKDKYQLDLKPGSVTFTGHSDTLKKTYHVELPLYAEIDPDESKVNHTPRDVEMKLQKKELNDEYWPRLLKDAKKVHFLKTDFDKWVDEDEQNEAAEDEFANFGGGGGMGTQPPSPFLTLFPPGT